MGRTSDAKKRLIEAGIELIWSRSYGSVSVDALCERAQVRKGSFYHFFPSKSDLVAEALEWSYQQRRPELDRIFSPCRPPLQRIEDYCSLVYGHQLELHRQTGQVRGCFLTSVGCEVSKEEPRIRQKVQELLGYSCRYFESALRDAQSEGAIRVNDVPSTARMLLALVEGVLSQARIENDPERLKGLWACVQQMLGLPSADAARFNINRSS